MQFLAKIRNMKGVGVGFWNLLITPQNNSRAVMRNLKMLVCRSWTSSNDSIFHYEISV